MKALTYTRTAIKALRKMPKNDGTAIQAKLADYAAGGKQDVKALQGSDMLRLRHGTWRAIFTDDGLVVAAPPSLRSKRGKPFYARWRFAKKG